MPLLVQLYRALDLVLFFFFLPLFLFKTLLHLRNIKKNAGLIFECSKVIFFFLRLVVTNYSNKRFYLIFIHVYNVLRLYVFSHYCPHFLLLWLLFVCLFYLINFYFGYNISDLLKVIVVVLQW